jgi:hypothetical protein
MGRYYFGTISGKFWGSLQSSEDATNFKNPINFYGPSDCYEYMGCCCIVEDMDELYCKKCYESLEEHVNKMKEEDEDMYINYLGCKNLIYENNLVKYYFDKNELDYIKKKLHKLEEEIGKHIIDDLHIVLFDNTKDDCNTCYDYEINEKCLEDMDDKIFILVARWCLGKQIEFSIMNIDYCEIFCE